MVRLVLEYEIDNDKQESFIEVMKRMLDKSKELYPHVDVSYYFKWDGDLIEKVFYFFDFEDEPAFNDYFDLHQRDPKWLEFVSTEYHPPKFVTPKTSKLQMLYKLGTKPSGIELGAFDYMYSETGEKIPGING